MQPEFHHGLLERTPRRATQRATRRASQFPCPPPGPRKPSEALVAIGGKGRWTLEGAGWNRSGGAALPERCYSPHHADRHPAQSVKSAWSCGSAATWRPRAGGRKAGPQRDRRAICVRDRVGAHDDRRRRRGVRLRPAASARAAGAGPPSPSWQPDARHRAAAAGEDGGEHRAIERNLGEQER